MFELRFLGTGGGMPMTYRALSSVMIGYQGRKILFDCGEGTQVSMRRYHTGFRDLDIILLSHFHGDHIFGLPGLLSTMGNSERTEKLTIVGPKGLKKVVNGLLYSLGRLSFPIEFMEEPKPFYLTLDRGILEVSPKKTDLFVDMGHLKHSVPCLGYGLHLERRPKFDVERAKGLNIPVQYWSRLQHGEKVEWDGKLYVPEDVLGEERRGIHLALATDTRPCDEIVRLAEGSDLLICEGTYGEETDHDKALKNKHMTFSEAALLAKRAGAKELLLTHFSPSIDKPEAYIDNARRLFPESYCAQDGLSSTIHFES